MKKVLVLLVMFLFGASLLGTVYAQEQKFAYVDMFKIFNEYKKTEKYDKKLQDDKNAKTKEREKSVDEIKKLQEKLSIVSKEEKDKTQKDLEDKIKVLQQFENQATMELSKEYNNMREEIVNEIKKAIKEYAEKNNITFVFQDLALAYINPSLNITDQIIKILNEGK
ncbi:MAG: OmpH family outer membrane protein [Candidatus Omnitrophica bacterium]|nr:OmpH family outer membrane protein [Candidatus Omnitrophota bacterium]HOX53914.1 OmpH family outer membrane protein [Candidatus Omnitrophota bacterium]